MNLRTCCLLLAMTAVAGTGAHATDCPGLFSDTGVSITGTVVEHMEGAGMLKIETEECGKISVGIPAQNKEKLGHFYEECPLGSMASVDGDTTMSILEATELSCK